MSDGWRKVGEVGVDAGLCMIGDPCYVLHRGKKVFDGVVLDPTHPEFGSSWSDFCEKLRDGPVHQVDRRLAVVVATGYGDGIYPVEARFDADGRVCEVRVTFIPEEGK